MYICALCVCLVPKEAKRLPKGGCLELVSLELEVQVVVIHHVGPGNGILVLWKGSH